MAVFASKDDALAVFVQPDETTPLYYQMAFNTRGVQFDQRVKGGQRDYDFHPEWRTAVAVADKYWTAEVKLPFKAFGVAGKGETQWRMDLFRLTRNGILPPGEWCLAYGEWHTPERFGKIVFAE